MQGLLSGRTAVVTGAAHGIGGATAFQVADQGASLILGGIDEAAQTGQPEGVERFRKVVTISSIACTGNACQSNYGAARAAILSWSKPLAKGWARIEVNVNSVAFGSIDTPLIEPRTPDSVAMLGLSA